MHPQRGNAKLPRPDDATPLATQPADPNSAADQGGLQPPTASAQHQRQDPYAPPPDTIDATSTMADAQAHQDQRQQHLQQQAFTSQHAWRSPPPPGGGGFPVPPSMFPPSIFQQSTGSQPPMYYDAQFGGSVLAGFTPGGEAIMHVPGPVFTPSGGFDFMQQQQQQQHQPRHHQPHHQQHPQHQQHHHQQQQAMMTGHPLYMYPQGWAGMSYSPSVYFPPFRQRSDGSFVGSDEAIGAYAQRNPALSTYIRDSGPGRPIQETPTGQGPEGCNLFVFHIPNDMTNLDLYSLFNPFGRVISARIMVDKFDGRSRGFGFVSFDNSKSATEAIRKMNGLQVGRKRLKVQHKKDPKPRHSPRSADRIEPGSGGGGGGGGGNTSTNHGRSTAAVEAAREPVNGAVNPQEQTPDPEPASAAPGPNAALDQGTLAPPQDPAAPAGGQPPEQEPEQQQDELVAGMGMLGLDEPHTSSSKLERRPVEAAGLA